MAYVYGPTPPDRRRLPLPVGRDVKQRYRSEGGVTPSMPRRSMHVVKQVIGLGLALTLAGPIPTLAWGKAGHRVVATIATTLLTGEARAQVADLLDPGTTLADISTWADEVRPSRPNTAPWHYGNIPGEASGYSAQRDCSRGCVVSAIERSLRLLQDPSNDRAIRQEALKWLVHFVADLHQPLHAIADERGGNDLIVQFNGHQTNLHRFWDGDMIDRAYPGQAMLQDQLL